jgi:hypothetical protein
MRTTMKGRAIVALLAVLCMPIRGMGNPDAQENKELTGNVSGVHWVKSNSGIEKEGIGLIVILPSGVIFAATAATAHDVSTRTLFRSTDGGDTWVDLTERLPLQLSYADLPPPFRSKIEAAARTVQFMFAQGESIFVALDDNVNKKKGQRLLKSEDRGSSWTEVNKGFLAGLYAKDLEVLLDGSILLLAEDLNPESPSAPAAYFFRSTDGGQKWESVHANNHNFADMAIAADGAVLGYSPTAGMMRSMDGGRNWVLEKTDTAPLRTLVPSGIGSPSQWLRVPCLANRSLEALARPRPDLGGTRGP